MSRQFGGTLAAVALFAGFLAYLFPTDVVARRLLSRLELPGGAAVVFTRAALRSDGIWLDNVTVRAPTGAELVHAEAVRLRPSPWGLVRGAGGLPWSLHAAICGGTADATISADGTATAVALTWHDADLAQCPPLPIAAGALAGRARGAARLRLGLTSELEGAGNVELESGTWRAGGALALLGALHAESASVHWTLRQGSLVLDALDLHGPEVSATGSGEVRLEDPVEASGVRLTVAVASVPGAPGPFGLLLRPADDGTTRQLTVGGTLAHPSAVLQ